MWTEREIMALDITELEFKYAADHISLSDFMHLFSSRGLPLTVVNDSMDIYYTKLGMDGFQRHRPAMRELTKKLKTSRHNNYHLIESDIYLDSRTTIEAVKFHLGLDGYQESFRITKSNTIYNDAYLSYVYYTVTDEHNQTRNFIEVEVRKDKVEFLGREAFEMLISGERDLAYLGITSGDRLKQSLFEIYHVRNEYEKGYMGGR